MPIHAIEKDNSLVATIWHQKPCSDRRCSMYSSATVSPTEAPTLFDRLSDDAITHDNNYGAP
jgi:hypothetical protein